MYSSKFDPVFTKNLKIPDRNQKRHSELLCKRRFSRHWGKGTVFDQKNDVFFTQTDFFLCLKLSLPECAYNIELADPSTLPFKQKCGKNCILKHEKTSKNINFGSEMALKMPILFSQNIDT